MIDAEIETGSGSKNLKTTCLDDPHFTVKFTVIYFAIMS